MASTTSAPFAEGDFRVGRVINRSISILSRRFVTLFIIATAAYLPTFLISLWMLGFSWTGRRVLGQAEQVISFILLAVAFPLFSVLGHAMIVHATFQDMRNWPATLGTSVKVGLRRFLPLFGIAILLTILIFIASTLFVALTARITPFLLVLAPIPMVVIVTVCFVTTPACVVEKRGPFGSVRRSAQLTNGHRWRIFGLEVLLVGLLLITSIIIGLLDWALIALAGPLLAAISDLIWTEVWLAYCGVMVAVAYHDLRVAKEGIDIEQIASVFD
jgi:hypothetical protein